MHLKSLVKQNISGQWQFFVSSLFDTLEASYPAQERVSFLTKMGKHASRSLDIHPELTLVELNEHINQFWFERRWGHCNIFEKDNGLVIEHYISPLCAILKPEHQEYGDAFLTGLYSEWLKNASAPYQGIIKKVNAENIDDIAVRLSYHVI
ncbi:hypothetical protein [Pseudoalteromonas sp. MMG024]|uniref:cellulose biosynthesis protein BcsD n=1 Tax=Pseudoalteromonas sp. MMG024 TaxID=2909980 RepID=UPI001F40B529|nr:hypothetical protein [Pseudoalteromonas sp. MMG024]MCF6456010.1 hypothetical protein [Pseudoalteromonas sp. MMG024]